MFVKFLQKLFGGGRAASAAPGSRGGEGPLAFVDYVVRELVDNPGAVETTVEETDQKVAISVRCAKEDMGKVIGRQGRTISAIRALAAGTGKRGGKRIMVDVLD